MLEWHEWPDVPSDEDHACATFLVHVECETKSVGGREWVFCPWTAMCAWDAEAQEFVLDDNDIDGTPVKPSEDGRWSRNERLWWCGINPPKESLAIDKAIDRVNEREGEREEREDERRRYREDDYYCDRSWEERWDA